MTWLDATLYGVIQGLSEFLPISSSAHLALIPHFTEITDPGVAFDFMMHIGTALSLIVYFRQKLLKYAKSLWRRESTSMVSNLLIAFGTTSVVALLLKAVAFTHGRSVLFIALNLAIFGILLWVSDRTVVKTNLVMEQKLQWKRALLIGAVQALAIFPGVSRSGATLTAARFTGLSRHESLEFSFLLALPVVLAAAVLQVPELFQAPQGEQLLLVGLWGVFVSFVVGYFTIHFFMKMVSRVPFSWFMIYRLALAVFLFL